MNNRHRRVERLRRKYETPAENWSRGIIQAFLKVGQVAREAGKILEKDSPVYLGQEVQTASCFS